MADGVHQFTAKATDAAGNSGNLSSAYLLTVDTTAPIAPVLAAFTPDTGVTGDGITNTNHVTVTGTAEANSTVQVYDGSALLGTTSVDANGQWSFATATLADGDHAFSSVAIDAAGNSSASATALNVTVDTTAPDAPIISGTTPVGPAAGASLTAAANGFANTDHVKLTGTAAAGSTLQIFDNGDVARHGLCNVVWCVELQHCDPCGWGALFHGTSDRWRR